MTEQNQDNLSLKKGTEDNYTFKLVLRAAAAFCGVVCAVLFSVALVRDLIPDKQIFEYGSNLFKGTMYASVILSLVCMIFAALIPKNKTKDNDAELPEYPEYYRTDSVIMKVCRMLCAVVILAQGGVRAYLFFIGGLLPHPSAVITALSVVLVFPLCLYLVPEISQKTAPGFKNTHLAFGAIGVFWFVLMVIYLYFDKTIVLSSPYKLMCQLAYISQLLAIVEEIRSHTSFPAPRARLATLCFGFITTFSFNVGRVVMMIGGKICSAEDAVNAVIGAALAVYFGARLFFYDEY